jgi:hypothetical protein
MRSFLRSSPTGFFGCLLVVIVLFACAACESATPSARYPLAAHPSLSFAVPAVAASDSASLELRQVFAQWQEARATADAPALEALYDVRRFEGIRWTRSGIEKRMTWAEWNGEQRPLPGHAALASRPVYESWPGGTLDAATASVAFDEAGINGAGATRRVLVFGRSPDGKLRIVREELGGTSVGAASVGSGSLSRDAKVLRALAE